MDIKVEKLTKKYGAQEALCDLSFMLSGPGITGLLGPNGAGKSTTMKILAGILENYNGSVRIDGQDLLAGSHFLKKKIGFLPENNPLYDEMYVLEYLEFVAKIHSLKYKNEKISAIIEQCGIRPEVGKKIGQLSKGYRQRVGIAQAILHDPELIILDEPISGLDPSQLIEIRKLIMSLGKEKTILFSSHILQEVEALCDHIIVLNKGKKVLDGPIATVTKQMHDAHKWVAVFDKDPRDWNVYQSIGEKSEFFYDKREIHWWTKSSDQLGREIFMKAVEQGDVIVHLVSEERSMENVFQNLVQ